MIYGAFGKNNNHNATNGNMVIFENRCLKRYNQLEIKNGMNAKNKFQTKNKNPICLVTITRSTIKPKLKKHDAINNKVSSNRRCFLSC